MSSKWLNLKASDRGKLKKGPWTFEEDIRLLRFIKIHGPSRWSALAKVSGLQRCGKSCRLRWVNYLRPDLKRGSITPEEERLILDLQARFGNRWSLIAEKIPGRTDNEIKNFWRSRIRKRLPASQFSDHHEAVLNMSSSNMLTISKSTADHNQLLSPSETGIHDSERTIVPNLAVSDSSAAVAAAGGKLYEQSCEAPTAAFNNAEAEAFSAGAKWDEDEEYYRCPWSEQDALMPIVYQFYLGIHTDDVSASNVTTMSTDSSDQSDSCLDLEALWNNQFLC